MRISPERMAIISQRLEAKQRQKDEDLQLRRRIKEYAARKAIDAQFDAQEKGQKQMRERQTSRAELEDPTASWKKDIRKEAKGEMAEQRYQDLYRKKQEGTLKPTEEAQYNLAAKKATGSLPKSKDGKDFTPYQETTMNRQKNNALAGVKDILTFAKYNNGMIRVKGELVPVTRDKIRTYLMKYHKGIDVTDPEINNLIEEQMSGIPKGGTQPKKQSWLQGLFGGK